ncbi:30S ribosomal protein S6 [Candidatus Nomurabacteria bacterium]|nr:30S ribosomal protein S6 [Candidatus Nomurabacteria bacterium]
MSKNETLDMDKVTLYEVAFNIIPTLGDDGATKTFEQAKKAVEKVKVETLIESSPALLPLKYTMSKTVDSKKQKHNTAYFAWVKFDADPSQIESLKEELDHITGILRYMVIKTEKETNLSANEVAEMLSGKSEEVEENKTEEKNNEVESEVVEEGEAEIEASSDEEVDKAIDEMVGDNKEEAVA